jgi:acetoin utilization deacetylase AcuC-like enzyme
MTLLFRDPLFQRHDTGRHPERASRLRWIDEYLDKAGLPARCTTASYEPLAEQALLAIHDPRQVELAKSMAHQGGGQIDADTIVSSESFQVALAAAGACVSAVTQILAGADKTALCLVRPPGHHATQHQSMGFCLFNNVALAADHARRNLDLNRILIVDWDVHHGNGTQDIFYADPQITFFSIHRYGHGFYPGTGAASETGTGPGLGHTLNAPIRFGTPRREYHAHFRATLEKAADRVKPELVLLSAGFDAHALDPIGSLGLEVEDFAELTRAVVEVARTHAQGRLVSCLEGGYNLQALAESVQAHLETLLASDQPD